MARQSYPCDSSCLGPAPCRLCPQGSEGSTLNKSYVFVFSCFSVLLKFLYVT